MTDKQLASTLQDHKAWLGNRHGTGKRADLRGAILRRVNLEAADLRWCDLRAADLSGANLTKTDFTGADMRGCDLRGACCVGTVFVNARLDGANMDGADLRSAVMEYAQLPGANIGRKSTLARMKEGMPASEAAKEKPKEQHRGMER